MTRIVWVCGRGGLLGSEVERVCTRPGWIVFKPNLLAFPWTQRDPLDAGLRDEAQAFGRFLETSSATAWSLYWCAGAGVVSTSEAALVEECRTFETFLGSLGAALARSPISSLKGNFFLASSAGGVYAGSSARPITEHCAPSPISPYGRAKLAQEEALTRWVVNHPNVRALIGRISNLYGPGQNMAKPQGLISHMSRSVVHRIPIHIYVPLDTLRDYLFVTDAAEAVVRWTERLPRDARRVIAKICASEQDTTIASLIATFRRIARRQVKVVSGLHPVQNRQPTVLQFRSIEWTDDPMRPSTTLLSGTERIYRNHLWLHAQGQLAPPLPMRV